MLKFVFFFCIALTWRQNEDFFCIFRSCIVNAYCVTLFYRLCALWLIIQKLKRGKICAHVGAFGWKWRYVGGVDKALSIPRLWRRLLVAVTINWVMSRFLVAFLIWVIAKLMLTIFPSIKRSHPDILEHDVLRTKKPQCHHLVDTKWLLFRLMNLKQFINNSLPFLKRLYVKLEQRQWRID